MRCITLRWTWVIIYKTTSIYIVIFKHINVSLQIMYAKLYKITLWTNLASYCKYVT